MKVLVILFFSLLLASCSQVPTTEEYETAKKWCDDFGGIKVVTSSFVGGLRARCNDSKLIIDDKSG